MTRAAEKLVLGIDASTTAVKAHVIDHNGDMLAEGRAPIPLDNPGPEAWEQDAEHWWSALVVAVSTALERLAPDARARVRALSIACQRETFVVCDRSGTPLAPAIVWMDGRAKREVQLVKGELEPSRIHSLSGKPPCVTPSLYKIRFLLDRARPDLAKIALTIFDVHGFLAFRLTGRRATSLASADPLGLVDLARCAWSEELANLAHVPLDALPELVATGAPIGTVTDAVASELGLPRGVIVVAGAGDGQAAGLGAGVTAITAASTTRVGYMNVGTALVAGVVSDRLLIDRAFRTLYGCAPGTFFLETDLKGGTFTLDWLADRILGGKTALLADDARSRALSELERSASSLPPGASGLVSVPYWLGVMNPVWDDDATGILLGLRGDHGPAHLYRSIVEGLAFEARHHLEGVEAVVGRIDEVRVLGGASRSDLAMSVFADVLQKPLVRTGTSEATALGAAMLAGAALGWHGSVEAASRAMSTQGERVAVSSNTSKYDALYRQVYSGLFEDVRARMSRLAALTREP